LIVPVVDHRHRVRLRIKAMNRLGVLIAWACWLPIAGAVERPGDATAANELHGRAQSAAVIQKQLLALAEGAPRDEQFELYRTYDDAIGAWLQIEFVRRLLDASIAAKSSGDEQGFRTDLRDHARFALWQLDQHIANLDANIANGGPAEYLRLVGILRSLAAEARTSVVRLAAGQ
jgi:hypothetical protein